MTPSTSVAAAEIVVAGLLFAQAPRFVNTVPGLAFTEANVGPLLTQPATVIVPAPSAGRRAVRGLGAESVALTKNRRSPAVSIPSVSVRSVACHVLAPPPRVMGLVA